MEIVAALPYVVAQVTGHMMLNNPAEEFNIHRLFVEVDNFSYTLFATSSDTGCFSRGAEEHLVRACPSRLDPSALAGGVTNSDCGESSARPFLLSLNGGCP